MVGHTQMERRGTLLLAAAIVLVTASIVADGALARGLNGIAGLAWFAAAAMLVLAARARPAGMPVWTATVLLTALVAFVVKPSAFVPALVGFGLAGLAIGVIAARDLFLWAKVIVGLYLPFHIGTAVAKAAYRNLSGSEASIRSEPPPTAALVPVVMLLAALLGAWVAQRVRTVTPSRRAVFDRAS